MSNMTPVELLAELNAFRAADGKEALKDWRRPRHMPMLEAYRAAADEPDALIINPETGAMMRESEIGNETTEGTPLTEADDQLVDILTNGAKVIETTTEDLPAPRVEVEGTNEEAPTTVKGMTEQAAKKAKQPTYKELANYDRSAVMKPVDFIHSFLSNNPHLTRKEAVSQLVQSGINFSTARTQYQRWFAKRKA